MYILADDISKHLFSFQNICQAISQEKKTLICCQLISYTDGQMLSQVKIFNVAGQQSHTGAMPKMLSLV